MEKQRRRPFITKEVLIVLTITTMQILVNMGTQYTKRAQSIADHGMAIVVPLHSHYGLSSYEEAVMVGLRVEVCFH